MTTRPDSAGVRLMPPAVFFACAAAGIVVWLVWGGTVPLVPWTVRWSSGAALAVAGFAFMGWGHRRFTRLGVAVKTILPASQLVTGGAYRFSRNPMYVGFVAILLGAGWFLGAVPLLAAAVVMYLYLDRYVIVREEAYLARTFGEAYKDYCARTRRWL